MTSVTYSALLAASGSNTQMTRDEEFPNLPTTITSKAGQPVQRWGPPKTDSKTTPAGANVPVNANAPANAPATLATTNASIDTRSIAPSIQLRTSFDPTKIIEPVQAKLDLLALNKTEETLAVVLKEATKLNVTDTDGTKMSQEDFSKLLESMRVIESLTKQQKLWTYQDKFRVSVCDDSLTSAFIRKMASQSREQNLKDLKWIFDKAFQKINFELDEREKWVKFLQTNKISISVDNLINQPNPSKTNEKSKTNVNANEDPSKTINRGDLNSIVVNLNNIRRSIDAIRKARNGLENLKLNADYKDDHEMLAGIQCLQDLIDSQLDQTEVNFRYFTTLQH